MIGKFLLPLEKINLTLSHLYLYVKAMKDKLSRRIVVVVVQTIQHVMIISRWQRQSHFLYLPLSLSKATSTSIAIAVASVNYWMKTRRKQKNSQNEQSNFANKSNFCVLSLLFICFTHFILSLQFHYFISFHTIHLN